MGFLRTVVKLAAVGVAANMIMKARREGAAKGMSMAGSGGGSSQTGASTLDAAGLPSGSGVLGGSGMSGGTGVSGGGSGLAGGDFGVGGGASGLQSPNDAERLEAKGLGSTSQPGRGASDKPFGSNSQEGASALSTGLADFSRGA